MLNKKNSTTALILSGGEGRRMQNKDKGLVLLNEKPLIQHVIDKIAPQVESIVISCNRNFEIYKSFNYPIVRDEHAQRLGPLAGISSAYSKITTDYCFIAPCDVPNLPFDIIQRLLTALGDADAVTTRINGRIEPLLTLCKSEALHKADKCLKTKNHAVKAWLSTLDTQVIDIKENTSNINDVDTLNKYASNI